MDQEQQDDAPARPHRYLKLGAISGGILAAASVGSVFTLEEAQPAVRVYPAILGALAFVGAGMGAGFLADLGFARRQVKERSLSTTKWGVIATACVTAPSTWRLITGIGTLSLRWISTSAFWIVLMTSILVRQSHRIELYALLCLFAGAAAYSSDWDVLWLLATAMFAAIALGAYKDPERIERAREAQRALFF